LNLQLNRNLHQKPNDHLQRIDNTGAWWKHSAGKAPVVLFKPAV
jgi:hypothetical protein